MSAFKSSFEQRPYACGPRVSTVSRRYVKALLKCPLSYLIKNVPFFVFGFALCCRWPGPERSPAEPAGRSGGPGQRRSRRDGRQLRGPLLHLAPDSLSPRMLRWRYPLRLGPRRTRPGGPLRSLLENRLGRCGDLLPTQRAPSILDLDTTVPPLAHQHLAPRRRIATLRLELEKAVLVSHHPVLADRAFALQPENLVQFRGPRRTSVIILPLRC